MKATTLSIKSAKFLLIFLCRRPLVTMVCIWLRCVLGPFDIIWYHLICEMDQCISYFCLMIFLCDTWIIFPCYSLTFNEEILLMPTQKLLIILLLLSAAWQRLVNSLVAVSWQSFAALGHFKTACWQIIRGCHKNSAIPKSCLQLSYK